MKTPSLIRGISLVILVGFGSACGDPSLGRHGDLTSSRDEQAGRPSEKQDEQGNPSRPRWSSPAETSVSAQVSAETRDLLALLSSDQAMNRFAPSSYTLLARAVKERVLDEGRRNSFSGALAYRDLIPKPDDVASSLNAARAQYESIKESYEFGHKVLAANNKLVDTALRVGASAATVSGVGTLGGLALGAVAEASSAGLDKVLSMYDESAADAASKFLFLKLRELPEAAWRDWDNLPNLSPDEARAFVAERVHQWSSAIGAEGPGAEARAVRAVMDGYLIRATIGQLAREQSLRELADSQISENLEETAGQLSAISKTLLSFAKTTQEQLSSIQRQQREIKTGIEQIQGAIHAVDGEIRAVGDGVLAMNHSIGFVNEFVFGRMSPEEQLRALKQGVFPGLEEAKRKELENKIELVQKRRDLEEKAAEFLNGAQMLINIGANLGVNPKLLNTAQEIVKAGGVLKTAFSALMSGSGYLGAIEAVGGLLGIGGPNIADQRHQEVMNHLNSLAAGQSAILRGQEEILEGQRVLAENQKVLLSYSQAIIENQQLMLENQKELFKGLVQVSEQIHAYHVEVLEKLDRIHTDILFNRDMVRLVASKSALMCNNFLSSRSESDRFDGRSGQFANFSGLMGHFNEYSREFFSCVDGLEELIGNVDLSKVFLSSEAFKQRGNGIDEYINGIFLPTSAYLKAKFGKDSTLPLGLAIPSAHTAGVAIKYEELKDRSDLAPSFEVALLEEPVAVDALEKYVGYLIAVYPTFDLVSYQGGGSLDDVETILTRASSGLKRKKAALLLKRALSLIQLAIAQETLIAGDRLLEKIYDEAFESVPADCGTQASQGKASCVLQANPLLARNFLVYGLRRDLQEKGNSYLAYDVAAGLQGDPRLLNALTGKGWNFVWENGRWAIRVGSRSVPLPTSTDLFEDRLEYRFEMQRLVQLRDEISGILAEVELGTQLDSAGKRNMYHLLLHGL